MEAAAALHAAPRRRPRPAVLRHAARAQGAKHSCKEEGEFQTKLYGDLVTI